MNLFALPIANAVLPRPDGGVLQGVFLDPYFSQMLLKTGIGGEIFIFPISMEEGGLYPVGVLARIEDIWKDTLPGGKASGLFARVIGRDNCRAKNFDFTDEGLVAYGVEKLDFQKLRDEGYPVISGAGWYPRGGYTTFDSNRKNIEITVYGFEYETGRDVAIVGRLNGEIEPEKAHTIEHAIIRSLKNYAICTPRTLRESMRKETEELKWSVEVGIARKLPEVFGVTKSGICGNPLTQMASYYLTEEFKNQIKRGSSLIDSINEARSRTVSRITRDMDITSEPGLRHIQGLKKGMFHDDTPEELRILKRVIMKFPQDPWH